MFTFHFRLSSKIASEEEKVNRVMTRGEIYIETENGLFPSIEWGDGILSTVNMWIGNTIRIVDSSNGEQNVTNYFMDGPYSFDIQKNWWKSYYYKVYAARR